MGLLGILAETIEGTLTKDKEEQISRALANDLVRVAGAADFDGLKRMMIETAQAVFDIFRELVDDPAADLPPALEEEPPAPVRPDPRPTPSPAKPPLLRRRPK